MTIQIFKGWYLALTLRRGVGIDLEFPYDKPVWITYIDEHGDLQTTISEYEGVEVLIPFFRITFGQLFSTGL